MGRILTVTNSNSNNRGTRKKTIGREIVIGPNAIKFIAITIFAILAMIYLAQSTAGANRSIKVRDLDTKQSELKLQKERLEVEQTRLRSLKEIDNSSGQNGLQPITSVEHIQN